MNLDMKITMVDTNKIKPAAFEPPARLTPNALSELKRLIERAGQIYVPLMIDEQYNLIDGHRRLACAKILGIKNVPVRFMHGTKQEIHNAFGELNVSSRKLNAAEDTFVYLKGGAVSDKNLKPIVKLEQLIGRAELERAVQFSPNNRLSASSIMIMITVLKKYISKKMDESFWTRAAKWLIFQNQSFYVRTAVYTNMNEELIIAAIENNASLY